jgi:acetoin utilization deacetylase AcuC-like enzyme
LKKTGIFFHYQNGERLRDFPEALEGILSRDNVLYYDAFYPEKPPTAFDLEVIPLDVVLRVHSAHMVERVKRTHDFDGVMLSVSSTVAALRRMWSGEIDNAFVFTGYGDHHAGFDSFGGGCYFNGAAIAIRDLRSRFGDRRFAIIDTDAHHGDGSWEIFRDDADVLYMCFCSGGDYEENNNVNVNVPWRVSDSEYVELINKNFAPCAASFRPEAIFWNWGYDGTQGEYGDMGLSTEAHTMIARELKRIADEVCRGRLIVVLCGGSRRDMARRLIPPVIRVLAGEQSIVI